MQPSEPDPRSDAPPAAGRALSPDAADAFDFWPECGWRDLAHDDAGRLRPTPAWWRRLLQRPELAPVEESCAAERALHASALRDPLRRITDVDLALLKDPDARDNWRHFLRLRQRLAQAGTVEGAYRGLFDGSGVDVPPLFVELLAQLIVRDLLEGCDAEPDGAWLARAGELLFRPQRISTEGGTVLAGDQAELDMLDETGGFGELGRLLAQANAPRRMAQLQVLSDDTAADYWRAAAAGLRRPFLLDLRLQTAAPLAHGLAVPLPLARSAPKALARVLERWVQRLLGVAVRITPLPRIDDERWRWHVGLDVEASALLDALWRDETLSAERQARLLVLFKLEFANPAEMRADLAGAPVYLALAMNAQGVLKMKPQNLLLNLPLAAAS